MKVRTSAVVAAALLALGAAAAADREEAAIRRRVEEIRDSDNNAWRKIPWAPSLLAARKAAAAEKRPVFLFSHDGNIDTGRC